MKLITNDLLDNLTAQAIKSNRKRSHYNIHESLDDVVQKLIVAATTDSYFRPHRHNEKNEFAFVIRGSFVVFEFDDKGNICQSQLVGEKESVNGIEVAPNTWHSWLCLSDTAVFFETKQGPYNPSTASEFPSWAPDEGSREAQIFLKKLKDYTKQLF